MIQEATQKLGILLQARIPEPIGTGDLGGEELALASRGELGKAKLVQRGNYLSSPFKELESHLLHLTWQAKPVAAGDYSQRARTVWNTCGKA